MAHLHLGIYKNHYFYIRVLKSLEAANGSSRVGAERLADSRERGSGHLIRPSRHRHQHILVHQGGWEVERRRDPRGRWKGAGSASTSPRLVDPRMWRAERRCDLGVERLADPRERGSEHRILPSRHRHRWILAH
uniref:Uncharacterized protein n=1 Tax=Oryza meridionalis TaxID=40149 RepID=A0A0E0DGS8_9ORYZ